MDNYLKYYQRNNELDKLYIDKYSKITDKYYEKNCLELIVELCELANESRCFKYWSIKPVKKEELLEEYADCLSMLFCIFNHYNIKDINTVSMELSNDILISFNEIIRMCTLLMNGKNVNDVFLKKIFTYLLHIGKLLNLTDDEILDACYKKIYKCEDRLNTNY